MPLAGDPGGVSLEERHRRPEIDAAPQTLALPLVVAGSGAPQTPQRGCSTASGAATMNATRTSSNLVFTITVRLSTPIIERNTVVLSTPFSFALVRTLRQVETSAGVGVAGVRGRSGHPRKRQESPKVSAESTEQFSPGGVAY